MILNEIVRFLQKENAVESVLLITSISVAALIFTSLVLHFRSFAKNGKIYLKWSPPTSLGHLFSQFFEVFILCRIEWTGYQNNPNANLRIFATLYTTLAIASFGYLVYPLINNATPGDKLGERTPQMDIRSAAPESIHKKFTTNEAPRSEGQVKVENWREPSTTIVIALFALWLGMFWKEKKDLHSKWEYLAGMYNTLLQQPPKGSTIFSSRESLKVSLVVDAILMGMWAHRSFYPIFEEVIVDAYMTNEGLEPSHGSRDMLIKQLKERRITLTRDQGESLVLKYQAKVIAKDKNTLAARKDVA